MLTITHTYTMHLAKANNANTSFHSRVCIFCWSNSICSNAGKEKPELSTSTATCPMLAEISSPGASSDNVKNRSSSVAIPSPLAHLNATLPLMDVVVVVVGADDAPVSAKLSASVTGRSTAKADDKRLTTTLPLDDEAAAGWGKEAATVVKGLGAGDAEAGSFRLSMGGLCILLLLTDLLAFVSAAGAEAVRGAGPKE